MRETHYYCKHQLIRAGDIPPAVWLYSMISVKLVCVTGQTGGVGKVKNIWKYLQIKKLNKTKKPTKNSE